MSRPLRIEFEGAWYHVMNRGAAHQDVFVSDAQRERFLQLLAELLERFGIQTHAYCLMGNHYHLLLHTPLGNLGRGMRHLNGVYTQFFNRDLGRDGGLFRGRYKAILVDADAYLLHLSTYIHRNPLEAGMVQHLKDYPWSSYAAYAGHTKPPPWLYLDMVYSMLSGKAKRYRSFVANGVDEDLTQFYRGKTVSPILGDEGFKQQVLEQYGSDDPEIAERKRVLKPTSLDKIVEVVARALDCDPDQVYQSVRGRRNLARMMAAHFAHRSGKMTYPEIAAALKMGHYSAVASSLRRLEKLCRENKRVDRLKRAIQRELT